MTVTRRHALMGVACLFAAGSAVALKPRNRVSLLGDNKLEKLIPTSFAGWTERPTDALITPEDENSLASRLYSQIVGRLYVNDAGKMVMMLIAYGDTQNDLLQLHRPEVCYPAFGFSIVDTRRTDVQLGPKLAIPARALTATSSGRVEHILYWTRIGEHLPTNGQEQRVAKLSDQFAGIVPDGVLVRISTVGDDRDAAMLVNERFARDMVRAMAPQHRSALIGTDAARGLGGLPAIAGG